MRKRNRDVETSGGITKKMWFRIGKIKGWEIGTL